jgi:dipeptidase D
MSYLNILSPEPIWTYFEEICNIPRISKNEDKIRRYLLDFAKRNNLESREDEIGNILIIKPASRGMEDIKTLVLQSHMDMVGEKNADNPHDWANDPIIPYVTDGWVTARGTTLGADDGIGIASQMAVLTDSKLQSGRIECLFTVDEESGMTGAINLDPDFFTGRILLNLDSEDEGILYIGCAGGMDTVITMKYNPLPVKKTDEAYELSVTGLHGGHSGDEIHKGYGNSVKIITRLLSALSDKFDISLSSVDAGNLRNAIPREAFAVINVAPGYESGIKESVNEVYQALKDEFGNLEPELKIAVRQVTRPGNTLDPATREKLIGALTACPHGVISWSKDMEDLVETSSNLASVKFLANNIIKITTTQRSSIESARHDISITVEKCFTRVGADVQMTDGYPGWKPDMNSEILKICRGSYSRLFGKEPEVKAIHAGLECGLIHEKNKAIDMISFGPTIRGAHTPEEMISINSVKRFWDFLVDVIHNIPHK